MKTKIKINRKIYLSHLILVWFGLVYLIDFSLGGALTNLFALIPQLVTEEFEFWRLFTYPLASPNLPALLLFCLVFYFIGPKEEDNSSRSYLPLMLLMMSFLEGLVSTLAFEKSNIVLTGPDGLSFIVLTLFTFKNFRKKIILFRRNQLRTAVFSFGLLLTYTLCYAFWYNFTANSIPVVAALVNLVFGVVSGGSLYLHYLFIRKMVRRASETFPTYHDLPTPEEMSLAMIVQNELKRFNQSVSTDNPLADYEYYNEYTEERLNEILDKINEQGEKSLLPEEIDFLKGYSKNK